VTETYAAVDRVAVAAADRAAEVRREPEMLAKYRANIGGSIFILMVVLGGVLAWLGVV
jgi:multicomponent Na+:H+ antiporter subunit D